MGTAGFYTPVCEGLWWKDLESDRKAMSSDSVSEVQNTLQAFTNAGGDLHQAPGVIAPLTDDQVQPVTPEAVF